MDRNAPPSRPVAIAAGLIAIGSLLFSAIAAGHDSGEPPAPDQSVGQRAHFPWAGEELYYSVRVNDTEAMRGGVRAGQIQNRGDQYYVPLNGVAQSRGFLDAAYPIDDRANTFIDPTTFRPLRTEKEFDENDRFRSYDVDYLHSSFTAKVERKREGHEAHFESPIPNTTHDMITWMYELRKTGELSVGDRFSFYIYDGWLLSRLDLEVVGREDLLTPMGWFKTWRLSFRRSIMDAEVKNEEADEDNESDPQDDADEDDADDNPHPPTTRIKEEARHTGHLWLSRDENLIPVQVTIDTVFGAGRAVLIRYEPGTGR